jgi:D-erythro-7,8-dihydroneopterin triphosphate epimerase
MNIRIKNLLVRTIIGVNSSEREEKQDVIINFEIEIDARKAIATDHVEDTINYKTMAKRIIKEVEESQFYLLEKLADHILQIIMEEEKVKKATVSVDKPHALRFADSVSVSCSAERG